MRLFETNRINTFSNLSTRYYKMISGAADAGRLTPFKDNKHESAYNSRREAIWIGTNSFLYEVIWNEAFSS